MNHTTDAVLTCQQVLDEDLKLGRALYLTVVAALSMLVSGSVALIMQWNEQLMQHPNRLVYYMCISEAIAANASLIALIGNKWMICYFDLNWLFAYTTPGQMTPEQAFTRLRGTNYTVITYFQFLSLSLNFFLCLDLIITLRSPLSPHDRRMRYYKYASVIIAALCTCTTLDKYGGWKNNIEIILYQNSCGAAIVTFYMIFAIFSCAYSYRMTTRPGMSQSMRYSFIWRHIMYVLVYITVWLPYLGLTIYTVYVCLIEKNYKGVITPDQQAHFLENVQKWWEYNNTTTVFTGLLMGFIRVSEPSLFQVLISYLTCNRQVTQNKIPNTQLQFLMSSLNHELVYIILKSVSQKTVGTAKSHSDFTVYQNYDFLNKSSFTLDSIEIEHFQQWDVDFVLSQGSKAINEKQKSIREPLLSPTSHSVPVTEQRTLIINEDIKVTEWSPDVFAYLRHIDGYTNESLLESLDPEKNKDMVLKAGESQGKSGSFFIFSKDQKFIIKTMTDSDFNAFKRIMKSYFQRVCTDRSCLFARIYGIYTIKMEGEAPVVLIVMGNSKSNATMIQGVFDLKGSMINRYCKPIPGKPFKPTATLKDKNLLKMNLKQKWLNFRMSDRNQILATLHQDTKLLERFNLMDYSLLFCITENKDFFTKVGKSVSDQQKLSRVVRKEIEADFAKIKTQYTFLSKNCRYIYHIGIIDYLQDYHFEKKLENFAKEVLLMKGNNKEKGEISAVSPKRYAPRFLQFMTSNVIIDQNDYK